MEKKRGEEKLTSWNGETVGSGSVVNEVQFAYNNFSQIIADYQAHGGAVNTSTTPKVQYGYANGSANTIRPTTLTYPNGRVLNMNYGSANSMADALSRVAALIDSDGTTHLADYAYLGLGSSSPFGRGQDEGVVEVDYTEPEIKYTLVGTAGGNDPDTGDIYRGFDRFWRIKDSYWRTYGTSTDADRIKYGYDRNGSRTYRENTVATASGANFDEKYLYDLVDRLKHMDRGTLTAIKDAITNKNFAQCWSLDATGNWRKFLEDSNGDGAWNLDQARTANTVNEITDVSETVGSAWVTPVYNRAGNMTTIPKPADPTQSFAGTYDAWQRLVRLEDGANKVAEYEFDGAKRRTVKKTYAAGVLTETRHLYYTEPSLWQVVEERVGTSTSPNRQFVWGLRYIDDLVLRDRDTNDDGTLDERLYALQDANWNITSIATSAGSIQERYAYTAYGLPIVLTSAFLSRASTLYDWETTFGGYRFDWDVQLFIVRNRTLHVYFGWLTHDPLGISAGLNLYQYCDGGPIIATDATGEGLPAIIPLIIAAATHPLVIAGVVVVIGVLTIACVVTGLIRCRNDFQRCKQLNTGGMMPGGMFMLSRGNLCAQASCPFGFAKFEDAVECGERYEAKFLAECWRRWFGCVVFCGRLFRPTTLPCGPRLCNDLCCTSDFPGGW